MTGFIIWALVGCLFIGIGVYDLAGRKQAGFWANAKMPDVTDVRGYNRAVGKLWCVSGIIFILLGLPLLDRENSSLIIISVFGSLAWAIALMVIYETVICKKYRKKQ